MGIASLRGGSNRSTSLFRGRQRRLLFEKDLTLARKWKSPNRRPCVRHLLLLVAFALAFYWNITFTRQVQNNSLPEQMEQGPLSHVDYEWTPVPDEKAYPIVLYQARCVYTRWPAGWGNEMMRTLHALISTAVSKGSTSMGHHRQFACIQGYGGLIADMYSNIERCPPSLYHDNCYRGGTAGVGNNTITLGMADMRGFLATHLHKYPELLQLNATFADEIFQITGASYRVQDLQRSACGVHIRFGDIFSRKDEQMKEKDRKKTAKARGRACRSSDKNITECFEELVHVIRQKCPDPSIPTYIASDVPRFVPYFCEREEHDGTGRAFLSSCSPNLDVVNHINDVGVRLVNETDGYSINPKGLPTVMSILSDWLTLILLKKLTRIGQSTFSESASLGFSVVTPTAT